MTPAAEIILRYRSKGLVHYDLARAVEKHARLLDAFDPDVAAALRRIPLWNNQHKVRPNRWKRAGD